MKKLLLYKVLCDPFNKVVVTLLRRKRQKNETNIYDLLLTNGE